MAVRVEAPAGRERIVRPISSSMRLYRVLPLLLVVDAGVDLHQLTEAGPEAG